MTISSKMPDINLKLFRDQVYHCLGNAKNAVFELTDAAILTRNPSSLAELSLSPVFRRQWHSTYEALSDCRPSRDEMMTVYTKQIKSNSRPLLVGDHSAWFRPDAVTLQERTYEHKPSRISVNRPIGVGFGYSTIAYIPEEQGSWALPLLHERITSSETALSLLSQQLTKVCSQLDHRAIVVVDSQYGCGNFIKQTAAIHCDKLMRLSSNRCFWGEPKAYGGRGRPRKHGDKFKLNESETWHSEDEILEIEFNLFSLNSSAEVYHNLENRNHGSDSENTNQASHLILPTSERQCRILAQLETSHQQAEVWSEAVEASEGNIPKLKTLEKIVKQRKKPMETPVKYQVTNQEQPKYPIEIKYKAGQPIEYSLKLKDPKSYALLVEYFELTGTATPDGLIQRVLTEAISQLRKR